MYLSAPRLCSLINDARGLPPLKYKQQTVFHTGGLFDPKLYLMGESPCNLMGESPCNLMGESPNEREQYVMKIFKYKLNYNHIPQQYVSIELPQGAKVLSISEDGYIYAMVDPEASTGPVYFYVYWTGVECKDGYYLGSFTSYGLVYHVFMDYNYDWKIQSNSTEVTK